MPIAASTAASLHPLQHTAIPLLDENFKVAAEAATGSLSDRLMTSTRAALPAARYVCAMSGLSMTVGAIAYASPRDLGQSAVDRSILLGSAGMIILTASVRRLCQVGRRDPDTKHWGRDVHRAVVVAGAGSVALGSSNPLAAVALLGIEVGARLMGEVLDKGLRQQAEEVYPSGDLGADDPMGRARLAVTRSLAALTACGVAGAAVAFFLAGSPAATIGACAGSAVLVAGI